MQKKNKAEKQSEQFIVRLTPAEAVVLRRIAKNTKMTLSEVIRDALTIYL